MQPTRTVADNVRAEVARARATQTALAEHLGISQQSISAKLAGRTQFTITQLVAVADYLGVTTAELIGESTAA